MIPTPGVSECGVPEWGRYPQPLTRSAAALFASSVSGFGRFPAPAGTWFLDFHPLYSVQPEIAFLLAQMTMRNQIQVIMQR